MSKNLRSPSPRVGLRSKSKKMKKILLLVLPLLAADSFGEQKEERDKLEIRDLGLRLLRVKAGETKIGNDDVADIVKPYLGVRKVKISKDFFIGETEVTQFAWSAIMKKNPSAFKGPKLPVEQVTWKEAVHFCVRLTDRERQAGRIPQGMVYRLPSEAEWEYATQAGSDDIFFFGSKPAPIKDYAWFNQNSESRTHPVGLKKGNPWGIKDVYGNVREWCLDGYSPRPKGPLTDPLFGFSNPDKVNRGGSYDSCAECCKTFNRTNYGPGYQSSDLGLRIVLGSPQTGTSP